MALTRVVRAARHLLRWSYKPSGRHAVRLRVEPLEERLILSTLFFDDFEGDLSTWRGKGCTDASGQVIQQPHHGLIVEDPLRPGNHVLAFTDLISGGDIFSTPVSVIPGQLYVLSYEYRGLGSPVSLNGVIGFSEGNLDIPCNATFSFRHRWLAGTTLGSGVEDDLLVEDGQWHNYQVVFDPFATGTPGSDNMIRVMLEEFSGQVGDAMFDNIQLRLLNQPPTAIAGPGQTVASGAATGFDASASSDSDGTIVSYTWDFGDGTSYTETAGNAPDGAFDGKTTHLYADNGTYTVTLTVADDDGTTVSATQTVAVQNVAPIVEAGPDHSLILGQTLFVAASFDDPSRVLGETYTASIDWGDGIITEGTVDVAAGSVTASHGYSSAGFFTVVVTVTDNGDPAPGQPADPKSGSDSFQVTVILPVRIDIKPGSDPNTTNLANEGLIAVAISTTAEFDASRVNASTVLFAGASAVQSALEDVDGDGDLDMILQFRTQDTNLRAIYEQLLADDLNGDGILDSNQQEVQATMTSKTLEELLFEGADTMDLFLAGRALRELLDALAASGAI